MLGLLGVLAAYPHHLPPLLVVGPYSARDWLRESAPHLRLRYVFVHCQELNNPGKEGAGSLLLPSADSGFFHASNQE